MNSKLSTSLFVTLGLLVLLIGAMAVAGCTDNAKKTGEVPPLQMQSIKVSGSTTVLPIAQKAAEAYMATHPNADIQISGGGSGVGVQQIGEKTVDIGMSSRDLKATENTKYPDLIKHIVAKDGIAIVVNPKNEIKGIQAAAVADIYAGKITSWTQVPGAHMPDTNNQIVVIGRDSASGTREFFDTHANGILKGTPPTKSMLEKNSNGAVSQTIAQTPGAIGYVSIGFVDKSVKALPIWWNDPSKAVEPTKENVLSGVYPINRELFMFTNGQPTGLVKDYIDFILSPDGQKIAVSEGYVSLI
ncbi:MAG: phosphate ABC transporter substrate-binding protein [Methanoregula sp.]|nr:phosphate ABC transporter substrate-binding protein [Methanoregula sp.]